MYAEVKLLPCPSPPTKAILLAKMKEVAASNGWDLGFTDSNLPDKAWTVCWLSTYKPTDEIFKKDYRPSARKEKVDPKLFSLPPAFLIGLPKRVDSKKPKRIRLKTLNDVRRKGKELRMKEFRDQIIGDY